MQNSDTGRDELWFAARTIANVELKMRDYFCKNQIDCFIPSKKTLVTKRIRGKDIEIEVESPIIKNLIFFKTNFVIVNSLFNLNYRKIYRIRNTQGLITIPECEMDIFMSFVKCYSSRIKTSPSGYIVGDKMMIKEGPLANMQGILTKIDGKNLFTIHLKGVLIATVKIPKKDLIRVK